MSALANKHEAINLSQGFPNFDLDPALKELAQKYIRDGFNQYAPMPGLPALREVLCQKMNAAYQSALQADQHITITSGATQAIYTAISAFIHAGDEVIIIEPAYDCYAPTIKINGGIVVPYAMQFPDYRVDWSALEKLVTPKTKMIIVNNPNNPAGTNFRESDLIALESLADRHDLLVLSDEVYEHLTYDGRAHHSVLKYPALRKRSLVTFSFGKTFHATGWKIGYCVAPEFLTKEFRKVHQFNVFCVNHPLQKALAEYLKNPVHYNSLPAFYQDKRDFLSTALAVTPLKPLTCEGTYFQLYDYSTLSDLDDLSFAKWLTEEHGVATIPLSPFYLNGSDAKVVRFCFAKTEETLSKAAERLGRIGG